MSVCSPETAAWLVGSLRCGLVAVDGEGRVSAWNDEAARILAVDAAAGAAPPLGRPCAEVLAAHPALVRALLEATDGRERPSRTELELPGPDGAPARTIGFTVLAVRDGASAVRGAALLFRDLTDYERMDEQDRLRERLAALGEMAAGLAHEIRNPLAGMEVLAGLLRRRLRDRPEEAELVDELVGELRRLAGTVTASLEFVRPAAPRPEPVDVAKVLDESLSRARARVSFGGHVALEAASPLPTLHADPEALRAIFTNLAANALEAMVEQHDPPPALRVRVTVEEADHPAPPMRLRDGPLPAQPAARRVRELVVALEDNGPGIPAELQDRIFYPFFTTRPQGCGIGLATVQKLVTAHQGRIELESAPGRGTTFRVALPLAPDPVP